MIFTYAALFPPDGLARLLKHELLIVGAGYRTRPAPRTYSFAVARGITEPQAGNPAPSNAVALRFLVGCQIVGGSRLELLFGAVNSQAVVIGFELPERHGDILAAHPRKAPTSTTTFGAPPFSSRTISLTLPIFWFCRS